jgi:hypothetical protein
MDFGGPYRVALVDDPERVEPCDGEIRRGDHISASHVLSRSRSDHLRHAIRLCASGGGTSVHENSLLLDGDRALVACGAYLFALDLPSLRLEWATEVDWASCFAVYKIGGDYLVHGELSISRLSPDGNIRWQASGRDIFTGPFSIDEGFVLAEDFDKNRYRIDLASGRIEDLQ